MGVFEHPAAVAILKFTFIVHHRRRFSVVFVRPLPALVLALQAISRHEAEFFCDVQFVPRVTSLLLLRDFVARRTGLVRFGRSGFALSKTVRRREQSRSFKTETQNEHDRKQSPNASSGEQHR